MATAYQLSAWKNFIEDIFPHIKGEVLVLQDRQTEAVLGGIPVYRVRSSWFGQRLVSIPFASLGGPVLANPDHWNIMLPVILDRIQETGARRFDLRGLRTSHPLGQDLPEPAAEYLHHFLELPSSVEALPRLSKGVKHSISKVRRAGVEIRADPSPGTLDLLATLHEEARRRLGLPVYPARFFHALAEHLGERIFSVLTAVHDGEIIGLLVSLQFGGTVVYEHVAHTPAGRQLGVNHLLLQSSIEAAVRAGCQIYSFGRTDPANAGLLQFKRAWGTQEEKLSSWIFPQKSASRGAGELPGASAPGKMARWVFRSLPAPLARRAGEIFYRHWA
jgi:hypothetical protein